MVLRPDPAEACVGCYVEAFVRNSSPARFLKEELVKIGIGLLPLVDHVTIRTLDVEKRAKEFLRLGFAWDRSVGTNGILEYDDWWAKVYRKPGLPAVFIDQAFRGARGTTSVIPPWVHLFSDKILHHIALRVQDIERAVASLKKRGIRFANKIVGKRGSDLRQIFTAAEVRRGHPFTVVEIIERHRGFTGFQPPQADSLMKASLITVRKA